MTIELPNRVGEAPHVVGPAPHGQRSQVAPVMLQEELWSRMRALPYVFMAPTLVSVPHSRALHLPEGIGSRDPAAFQGGREFAHVHPHSDSSLHLMVEQELMDVVERSGWGVRHPAQPPVLVYGPRDRQELEVVWWLVQQSWQYAMTLGS
ncbi:hypothetical protein ASG73_00895 [Janibacter sp. Soil728]|uniref:luciferase domain-containing protein n=1 Tax=Janibacter sp. Soil728 TaxID=1736393 RepID=UPI0006FE85B1|nr:luciferase family protein [Janibacter sp. Soil728]KRE38957.1 hypothetical protein ASG73_00895 [Janibacter sp. Soil728]